MNKFQTSKDVQNIAEREAAFVTDFEIEAAFLH